MELIRRWLSGKQNFIVGSVLYKQYGHDEKLKRLFASKPDEYSRKRLVEALTDILEKPPGKPARSKHVEGDEMPESKDPALQTFRNEWLPLYQRMNYLRHQLDKYEGNSKESIAKREPIAFEVLELEQQCMAVWKRREYYQEKGTLPQIKEEEITIPEDPVELGLLIQSTKRNIRRNKQYARENPDEPIYPIRVKYYQQLMDRILKKEEDGKA